MTPHRCASTIHQGSSTGPLAAKLYVDGKRSVLPSEHYARARIRSPPKILRRLNGSGDVSSWKASHSGRFPRYKYQGVVRIYSCCVTHSGTGRPASWDTYSTIAAKKAAQR